jgi:AhpD family alkylhydroperoxidase
MTAKLDPFAVAPSLMKSWMGTSLAIHSSLEPSLVGLVEIRASQINGCANCLNMHTAAAREKGETEQRLYLLSAWREAPCYTERERAALGWTEALTRLSEGHTHQSAYEALSQEFSDEEQVKLTLMINIINGWNRLAVGFGLFVDPAAAKSIQAKAAAGWQASGTRMQRRVSTRCVQSSCASPTACLAPWLTPRTLCRRPSSAG